MTEIIRTIPLYQPFATLMLHGKIETRWIKKGRFHPFKLGRYLIYATKKKYKMLEAMEIMGADFEEGWKLYKEDPTYSLDHTEHGWVIAIGDLVSVTEIIGPVACQGTFVKFLIDPFGEKMLNALRFENVKRIVPFKIKGQQGIAHATAQQIAQIEYVL